MAEMKGLHNFIYEIKKCARAHVADLRCKMLTVCRQNAPGGGDARGAGAGQDSLCVWCVVLRPPEAHTLRSCASHVDAENPKKLKGYDRKKYMYKLMMIYLLGHKIAVIGFSEALNLVTSTKMREKLTVIRPAANAADKLYLESACLGGGLPACARSRSQSRSVVSRGVFCSLSALTSAARATSTSPS
jgi:hypothetical protein